jgi:hypothetical protein
VRGSRRTLALVLLGLAVTVGTGTGVALAAFSATTTNAGNTFSASATFPTSCSSPGSQTVTSVSDTSASEKHSSTNYGADSELTVRGGGGDHLRSFVRFALPSVPAGCSVTDATLRLRTTTLNSGLTYEVARVAAAWTEAGLTWDTQPATTGAVTTATTAAGWVTWTVTAQVAAMYAGSNHGLRIKDAAEGVGSTNPNQYSSREGSDPPELVVQWG